MATVIMCFIFLQSSHFDDDDDDDNNDNKDDFFFASSSIDDITSLHLIQYDCDIFCGTGTGMGYYSSKISTHRITMLHFVYYIISSIIILHRGTVFYYLFCTKEICHSCQKKRQIHSAIERSTTEL
mmetsp:Transcript_21927/g.22247  ORF Transcript_21927/g.22247 Transcript_21927/m.22247 type:complete len:126 (+) Transcript_21927:396-773(+)